MTGLIMKFAPIGVFGLIAWVAGTQDSELLVSLLQLIACLYLACILHIIIVYGGLLKFATGLSVFKFFKKIVPAQLMAYSTASSAATLPVTMQVAETKLGVSKVTSSFVLPLGTTVNMDGTALYQGICVIFVANGLGYDLTTADYVTIVLTSTLASIGSAGVPGAGLIMLSLVLSSVGLPSAEVIGLIAGVDRIMDMMRTTVNVTGDSVVALIVDKHEKTLNEEMFNDAPSTVSS
jgi:Na+/H+-dicarboxylate symporter